MLKLIHMLKICYKIISGKFLKLIVFLLGYMILAAGLMRDRLIGRFYFSLNKSADNPEGKIILVNARNHGNIPHLEWNISTYSGNMQS